MTQLKNLLFALIVLSACNKNEETDLITIPVDIYQDNPLPLSEISENIKAIELETTDECLIGEGVRRVLISDDHVIILDQPRMGNPNIFLFNGSGKFIRRIGQAGQGPGEYGNYISDIVADFEDKEIYVQSYKKLIKYDFEGNFIKEINIILEYLNFTKNRLTAINPTVVSGDVANLKTNIILYEINNNLQIVDSMLIFSFNRNLIEHITFAYNHHMTYTNGNMYLHYWNPTTDVNYYNNQDTLYQFKDKELIPHIRLKHNVEKSNTGLRTVFIYRSSRYIFEMRVGKMDGYFCYDLKTKKGYNMKNGYYDDIHTGKKNFKIKPFATDTDEFYYLYTNMKDSDKDEPNPTLYIGTLKK